MSRFIQLATRIAEFAGLRRADGDGGLSVDGAVPWPRAILRWVFFVLTYTVIGWLVFSSDAPRMTFGPALAWVSAIVTYAAGSRPAPRHRRGALATSAVVGLALAFSADRFNAGHAAPWTRLGLGTLCSAAATMAFIAVTHWPAKSLRAPTNITQ